MLLIADQLSIPSYAAWLVPTVVIGVIVQFGFGGVMTFAVWRLNTGQRKLERIEDQRDARVAAYEKRMEDASNQHARKMEDAAKANHELTNKLVDERFRAMSHEVNNHVMSFVRSLDDLGEKVKEADGVANSLNERDQRIELTIANKLDSLKDYIRDNAAGKKDLERHEQTVAGRADRQEDAVKKLEVAVAVLSSQIKPPFSPHGGKV